MARKRRNKAPEFDSDSESDSYSDSSTEGFDAMSQYALESPTAAIERFRSLYMDLGSDTVHGEGHPLVTLGAVLSQRLFKVDGGAGDYWRACIETELLLLLLDIIVDPNFFRHDRIFSDIVIICLSAFSRSWANTHPEESGPDCTTIPETVAEIFWERIEDVWDILWVGRENLRWPVRHSTGRVLDAVEGLVDDVRYLRYGPPDWIDDDPDAGLLIKSSILRLGFYTWVFGDLKISHNEGLVVFTCVCRLRDERGAGLTNLVADLVDIIGGDQIVGHIHDTLKGPSRLVGDTVRNCFIALEAFLEHGGNSILDAYHRKPLCLATCVALRRHQARRQRPSLDRWHLRQDIRLWMEASTQIIQSCRSFLLESLPPPPTKGHELMTLLIHGIGLIFAFYDLEQPSEKQGRLLSARTLPEDTEKCAERLKTCIGALCESIQSSRTGAMGCPRSVIDELCASKASWYALLFRLHRYPRATLDTSAALRMVVQSWMQLGLALAFFTSSGNNDAAALRARLCFWSRCEFHQRPSPKPLSVCKGCHDAWYCSKTCQRSDWKEGHRVECRRLMELDRQ
ncbi:hypothetical protein PENSPDRAFT_646659 [Peniophora sp. CONT]|nr:hypothetical protein PENSPDRAFT_646659 [Peniophora sp. CONT]